LDNRRNLDVLTIGTIPCSIKRNEMIEKINEIEDKP